MKKSLIALAAMSLVAAAFSYRARTGDEAFTYRMGAGFAGDVNRTHPASIVPVMVDLTVGQVPRSYGVPLLFNGANNTVRGFVAADHSDATPVPMAGVLARPFPVQAATAAGNFGQQLLTDSTSIQTDRPNDMLEDGYVMVQVRGANPTALTIDSDVYVFCSADEAGHVLGGFETAAIAGKTVKITNAKYRGPTDANGIGELRMFPAVS